jgi:hypothetical protein
MDKAMLKVISVYASLLACLLAILFVLDGASGQSLARICADLFGSLGVFAGAIFAAGYSMEPSQEPSEPSQEPSQEPSEPSQEPSETVQEPSETVQELTRDDLSAAMQRAADLALQYTCVQALDSTDESTILRRIAPLAGITSRLPKQNSKYQLESYAICGDATSMCCWLNRHPSETSKVLHIWKVYTLERECRALWENSGAVQRFPFTFDPQASLRGQDAFRYSIVAISLDRSKVIAEVLRVRSYRGKQSGQVSRIIQLFHCDLQKGDYTPLKILRKRSFDLHEIVERSPRPAEIGRDRT